MIRLTLALLFTFPGLAFGGHGTSYSASGNLNMEIAGAAGNGNLVVTGTLNLANMPTTATPVFAVLYATQTNNNTGLDATFNGNSMGVLGPIATDAGLPSLSTYAWVVTPHVFGPVSSYTYTIGQTHGNINGIAGVALLVVWTDPAEPFRTVWVQDGMQQVGESGAETENIVFTGVVPPGPTTAWVFTVYDDAPTTNEAVLYNGSTIGGPLVANLGLNASILSLNTISGASPNTLSISTVTDHLGWVVGALVIDPPPVPVESVTWGEIKSRHLPPETP